VSRDISAADDDTGAAMYALVSELYPICRSITGNGVRETLERLGTRIPLDIVDIPTGTPVLDWEIPKEWNIRDAYISDSTGHRVVDFQRHNLHVLGYSTPVRARLSIDALRPHLFSIPEHPSWIPYRTSYYRETWGFCLSHEQLESLTEPEYDVCIDSSLTDGSLTYGECLLPGETTDEVLISSHVCHPSLCNDNLSGIAVGAFLARALKQRQRRYSYRFLFAPGTIGAIAWLAGNRDTARRVKHGLVLTCVGDPGAFHYKKSRQGDATIDRAVGHVLRHQDVPHEIMDFSPYGYDERQFGSPGFDMPVGCLMRSVWGQFPEYHTSADDLSLVTAPALAGSLGICLEVVDLLDQNRTLLATHPHGEPALGRRGLYRTTATGPDADTLARLWVLNLSDGRHSLLDIADRAQIAFSRISAVAQELVQHGLLRAPEA